MFIFLKNDYSGNTLYALRILLFRKYSSMLFYSSLQMFNI